jgi:hypothetical protein
VKKVLLPFVGLCLISSSLYAAPYVFVEGGYSPMPAGQGGSQIFKLPIFANFFNTYTENFSNFKTDASPLLSAGIGWVQPLHSSFLTANRIELVYNQALSTQTKGTYSEIYSGNPNGSYNYSYQITSSQVFVNDMSTQSRNVRFPAK